MIRIVAPHFVAGLEHNTRVAKRCAPIIKYMLGWRLQQIREYCRTKHWQCEDI